MKSKYLKSIALISLATTSIGFAQNSETEFPVGEIQQNLDGLNTVIDPNAADRIQSKSAGGSTYYLFLGASGAAPTDSDLSYSYAGGGCMQQDGNSQGNGDFDLAVQLPDGHQILGWRYYWYDASASSSNAAMFAFDGAGGLTLLGNNTSTGDTGFGDFYLNIITDNVIVDNQNNYYGFRFNSDEDGTNQRMCGVRLFMDSNPI